MKSQSGKEQKNWPRNSRNERNLWNNWIENWHRAWHNVLLMLTRRFSRNMRRKRAKAKNRVPNTFSFNSVWGTEVYVVKCQVFSFACRCRWLEHALAQILVPKFILPIFQRIHLGNSADFHVSVAREQTPQTHTNWWITGIHLFQKKVL